LQLGISSASLYPTLPTETAVVQIAALGCRTVEIFLQTTREYRPAYAARLARVCQDIGVMVHSVHGPSSQFEPLIFYPYRRQNQDGLDTVKRILESAALLGANCYVFHGPLRVTGSDRARLVQGLAQVAQEAARWGIALALENVSWCAGWEPEVFTWLNGQGIANLYYTFDSKQARRSGFSAEAFLTAMGNRLVNVHLSDWSQVGSGLLPGQGEEDFQRLGALLQNYQGPVLLEVYGSWVKSAAQLREGWRHLRKILNKQAPI